MSGCEFPEELRDNQGCLPFRYFRQLEDPSCIPKVGECFTMQWGDNLPKKNSVTKKERKVTDTVTKKPDLILASETTETESIEIQPPSVDEIGKLVEQSGGGAAGVAVALIAVAGGGAAMKFYSDFSKNKHEEKMEKMRLEAESQKNSDGDHTACQAERATLQAALAETNEKLSRLESKQKSLALSVGDDMEDRINSIEKKLKRLSSG